MSTIVGQRHTHHPANRECLCGCQWVEGARGKIVQDADTPKLEALGMVYVSFATRHHGEVTVCYTLAEIGR